MCVVHRTRGAGDVSGTRAQFLAGEQQRCGRHGADLTREPGADDPRQMSPQCAHVGSLPRDTVRQKSVTRSAPRGDGGPRCRAIAIASIGITVTTGPSRPAPPPPPPWLRHPPAHTPP